MPLIRLMPKAGLYMCDSCGEMIEIKFKYDVLLPCPACKGMKYTSVFDLGMTKGDVMRIKQHGMKR